MLPDVSLKKNWLLQQRHEKLLIATSRKESVVSKSARVKTDDEAPEIEVVAVALKADEEAPEIPVAAAAVAPTANKEDPETDVAALARRTE